MKVKLTVTEGTEKGRSFSFDEPENFLLGRTAEGSKAHLRLSPDDTYVSRNHFLLEINPPDCFIRDAGSLNGTFILRPLEKTVYFLEGRDSDKDNYERKAEEHQKNWGYKTLKKSSDRLPLQHKDVIKIGKTTLLIEIEETKGYDISDYNRPAETICCIECGNKIIRKLEVRDARKLSSDDYICVTCMKKHAEVHNPKELYSCSECGRNVTDIADKDKKANEFRDVASYVCPDCISAYLQGNKPSSIGKYSILSELGSGGFGTVYLARHNVTGRLAALKLTKEVIKKDAALIYRFKREIAIMKKLKHLNLVRLYDEGITDNGNYYLVSEYLSKGNLAQYCYSRHNGKMPYQKASGLFTEALKGLSYFHDKGYVHRDIKPENILLLKDSEGRYHAKVADFGLARSFIMHGGTVTRANEWIGTTFYCPPEQILDFKNAHPATDVYAMGMAMYYILSGEFPYDFAIGPDAGKKKKQRDPIAFILGDDKPVSIGKKVSGLPAKLVLAIDLAIEKNLQKRTQTAEAFGKAIEGFAK
ncbi:MAG: protein kinase [Nitrospirae bacterium]|nr:protein kinase [Nitrospirota bacterium]